MSYTPFPSGQQVMASSAGVVIASDQSPVSVLAYIQPTNTSIFTVLKNSSVAVLQGTNPWITVPTSGSVIATQIANSVMGVRTDNASVVAVLSNSSVTTLQGTNPWVVNVPTPSYISYQAAGSVMAVSGSFSGGNSSVELLSTSASISTAVRYGYSSVMLMASTNHSVITVLSNSSVAVLQGTDPWKVNVPTPSYIMYQAAGSTLAVSGSFSGGNSSVELLSTSASISTAVRYGYASVMLMASTNSSVITVLSNSSVATLQGTNPWIVNVPTPSYISYQAAGSILAVSGSFSSGNTSVQLLGGVAVIGSVATLQGTNPWIVSQSGQWNVNSGSIVGTYLEKNAVTPSALGIPVLFKIDETNSVLSAVSPQSPLPIRGSVATLQGTNPWIVNMPSPSVVVIHPAGSVVQVRTDNASVVAVLSNSSVAVLQGTNPWVVNVPTPSYIAYQLAGSIMQVAGAGGGTQYLENAQAASVTGTAMMFKSNMTTSILTVVTPLTPLPVSVQGTIVVSNQTQGVSSVQLMSTSASIAVLVNNILTGNASVQLISTSASIIANQNYGYSSVMLMASTNSSVAVLASQNTNPWVIGSIVGTFSEDAAHTTADKGIFSLNVRNDTMSSVTSTDGDYGALSVGPVGEAIVANAPITKWFSVNASVMYGTSVQVVAAPGASIFTYITGIQVINESATASRVTITQGLGAVAASILTRLIAPAGGGSNSTYVNGIRVLDNNGISASINGVSSVLITITGFNSKT